MSMRNTSDTGLIMYKQKALWRSFLALSPAKDAAQQFSQGTIPDSIDIQQSYHDLYIDTAWIVLYTSYWLVIANQYFDPLISLG